MGTTHLVHLTLRRQLAVTPESCSGYRGYFGISPMIDSARRLTFLASEIEFPNDMIDSAHTYRVQKSIARGKYERIE